MTDQINVSAVPLGDDMRMYAVSCNRCGALGVHPHDGIHKYCALHLVMHGVAVPPDYQRYLET